MLIETFIRKQLGLKAHTVAKVEQTEKFIIIHIDRLGDRLLVAGSAGSDAGRSTECVRSGSGAICRCGSCR